MLTKKELIEKVLATFEAERTHDVAGNKKLLHKDFAVTDMVFATEASHFPRLSGSKLDALMQQAFQTNGREFVFKTVIADKQTQTVIVEFIESYPDIAAQKEYRTPQIAVCLFKDDLLYRTRHYMDPRLSYEYLSKGQIENAFE